MASAVLFFTASACLFLMLVNRVLIGLHIPSGKLLFMGAIGLFMTGLPAFYGFQSGWSRWILVPGAILGLVAIGEIRRVVIRRCHRGSPPRLERAMRLSRPLTTTKLLVSKYEVQHSAWRGPELRVAHISDIHMRDGSPSAYLAEIVSRIRDIDPDLVVVTGDFAARRRNLTRLPELLRPIASLCPTYAVLGNHDYWMDADAVARAIRSCGVDLLGDEARELDHGGAAVLLRGCEHPWGRDGLPQTLAPAGVFVIALTHTPDNIYRLSNAGAHVVFAGHFHAGQLRAPFVGPIVVPSRYGRRFDHGHFVVNGAHLFATSGVGASGPPFRIYCPPEIQIVSFA
jgi:predicted MPP superfamily phosphohydrolase